MKLVVLLAVSFCLLFTASCSYKLFSEPTDKPTEPTKDISRYTADQVILIAKNYSPESECWGYREAPSQPGGVVRCDAKWTWAVEYTGNGLWYVDKKCPCHDIIVKWYFHEDTGKFTRRLPALGIND
jgi:hypothetical protein